MVACRDCLGMGWTRMEDVMSKGIKKVVSGPLTGEDESAAGVVLQFPDGTKAACNLEDLSPEMVTRLAVHGLSQKLGDSYAGAASEENPLAYAKSRVNDVLAQLASGDWRVTGEGGPKVTLLARALARATGKDLSDCVAVIAAHDGDEDEGKAFKKTLRGQPAIKEATAAIKLEDAQKAAKKTAGASDEQEQDLGALFG